jgi:hypothetical protein
MAPISSLAHGFQARGPTYICQQCRHATLLRRPKRPYTFTQLVALSDGSVYTHRTTSPLPLYKPSKDTRNTPLWNPSSQKLMNVEADDAGRLRAFRARFGRGWDAQTIPTGDGEELEAGQGLEHEGNGEDSLMDLISGYGMEKEDSAKESKAGKEKDLSGQAKKR